MRQLRSYRPRLRPRSASRIGGIQGVTENERAFPTNECGDLLPNSIMSLLECSELSELSLDVPNYRLGGTSKWSVPSQEPHSIEQERSAALLERFDTLFRIRKNLVQVFISLDGLENHIVAQQSVERLKLPVVGVQMS